MITITALPSRVIGVGRVGENEHRRVAFDIAEYLEQYPNATFGLIHAPAGVEAYPVATVAVEGQQLIWTVTSSDVTREGQGRCELIVMQGETVAKSIIYMTQVLPALDGAGEAPEPWESWQEQMIGIAADVDASADRAEAASQAVQDMGATATTLEPGDDATVSKSVDPETGAVTLAFGIPTGPRGPQGEPGQDGVDGQPGRDGVDGVSPTASVTQTSTGATVTVTDASGTTTATLTNGRDGTDGQDGQDGYSPSVEVTEITGGHRVVVYDAEGGNSFDVMDGQPGQDGQRGPAGQDGAAGADGYSPTASVSKSGSTATITITDKNGTTTAQVSDGAAGSPGADGQDGQDGFSPTASVSKSGTTATITITDKNGTTTATVSDGQNGAPGQDGQDGTPGVDGTTFTPSVAANGDISWSNDGGKTNPQTVNIKGPQGESGAMVVETVTGTTPTITAQDNTRYVCGTVSTLSFTPCATGICDVIFQSGSTATVLTVPSTVKWPDWFNPASLDANTTYEINIMDGVYGAVGVWT